MRGRALINQNRACLLQPRLHDLLSALDSDLFVGFFHRNVLRYVICDVNLTPLGRCNREESSPETRRHREERRHSHSTVAPTKYQDSCVGDQTQHSLRKEPAVFESTAKAGSGKASRGRE